MKHGGASRKASRVPAEADSRRAGARAQPAEDRAEHHQRRVGRSDRIVSRIATPPKRRSAFPACRSPRIRAKAATSIIRGTEPRLNSMMIDGQRIPSPDPLIRQVAVDVVPSELLQSIEVSKALTPDMDGDSIGGSVNLVMKQAPEKLRLFGAVGGGYNELLSTASSRTTTASRPAGGSTAARSALIVSGERLGDEPRQPGHGGRLHADADAQRAEPALVPGQPPSRRVHRRVRRQAERRLAFTVRARVQPLHRRPREPAAGALRGRQPPHRSRAARPHAHRADLVARASPASASSTDRRRSTISCSAPTRISAIR